MGRSSVFSLEQIYRKQVVGTWSKIPEVFRYVNSVVGTVNPYGYARNGSNSGIDRIDFNNDTVTASAKGSMATGINETEYNSNFGNLNYGYITGGKGSGPAPQPSNWATTSISRIDYSNDATAASPKGPYSTPVYNHGGVGNNDYGYSIAGQDFGYPPPAIRYSTIVRMDYSNDTVSPPAKSNYPYEGSGNFGLSGTGNMDYGWIANGMNNSIVHRIDYANDTVSPPSRTYLDRFGVNGRKCTGNAFYGYWQGGYTQTKFSRVDFSNDTATGVTKGSSFQGYKNGSVTSKDYAYLYGNFYPYSSLVERMDYSNDDIAAAPKGPLSVTNGGGKHAAGVSAQQFGLPTGPVPATRSETYPAGGPNYGYIAGGDPSSTGGTYIYRIDFNADTTTAAPKGNLYVSRKSNSEGAVGNSSYGYFCGGWSPGHLSSIDRMDYGNDTATATPKGNLANPGNNWAAAGNTNYGWITAGESPSTGYMTSINRMDYSSDTGTTVRGNTDNYTRIGTAGNLSYGYWAGGQNPKTSRTVRLDYSNDTVWGTTKGPLNASKYNVEGAGNANYGYFAGGSTGVPSTDPSVVDRLDYSNDTATASPRGNLSGKMSDDAATANGSYGYFAPGPSGQPNKRSIDRVDFSNDTATASPRGNIINDADGRMGISPLENGLPSPTTNTVDKGADGYTVAGPLGPAYGYWIAGDGGGSRYHRVDFSNDTGTAGVRGNLDRSMSRNVAVSSMNYAYAAGGYSNTNISRIDYADDTATATPKGNLPPISGLSSPAGVDTINYGYICGGLPLTTVNRIDFSNDTAVASAKGPLTATRRYISAAGNSSYGYVAGGSPAPGYMSSVDRIDYSNDTATASVKGPLSYIVIGHGMTGNADYGYVNGGFNAIPGSNNWISSTNRIDYSNDTATASPKGPLTQIRKTKSTGSTSYGWSGGGSTSGHAGTSTMDRIDYANDTATASARGSLSGTRTNHYAAGAQANAKQGAPSFIPRIRWVDSAAEASASVAGPAFGFFGGGYNPSVSGGASTMSRIDYANDTATALQKGSISLPTWAGGATGNANYGYWGGGATNPGPQTTIVSRLDYANDSTDTVAKGPLTVARRDIEATGNLSYGYFAGGPGSTRIERIDYGNDTATASVKGPLSAAAYGQGASGNSSYGYWAGGNIPETTTVNRVDYANDTGTTPTKGPLNAGKVYTASSGNGNYGYWAGSIYPGSQSGSLVDRIDYANDTATAAPKGPLDNTQSRHSGTGNASYGYFGGGDINIQQPSNRFRSIVQRIDFANDTATSSPKGPLYLGLSWPNATSGIMNGFPQTTAAAVAAPVQPPFPYPVQLPAPPPPGPAYGYAMGGPASSPNNTTTVQRIDYGNDTATAVVKGPLSLDRKNQGAAGNASYGYNAGGHINPGFTMTSSTDRIDYSNDSATASPKGLLSFSIANTGSVSNASYGWFGGGGPPNTSKVDRLDFSNDTATASPKGPITSAKNSMGHVGNADYGYLAGGIQPGAISSIDRIDYSNDSATASPKGTLSGTREAIASFGNMNYGYFAGGYPAGPESTVDRIDYSNDTATASTKGPLNEGKRFSEGTASASGYGYAIGGNPGSGMTSGISRVEFANDTATGLSKGTLSAARAYYATVSAQNGGLP